MPLVPIANATATDASQLNQLINLLTGVMNDQPVTLKGDYGTVGPNLRLGSVTAATKGGAMSWADAGSTKWELLKESDNSLKLWDSVRGGYIAQFNSNGDILLPSTAKLLGSADFRTATRLIAGADPGSGGVGDIITNRGGTSPGSGAVFFGNAAGAHYIYYDGLRFYVTDSIDIATGLLTLFGRSALRDYGDGYLRLNDGSVYGNGVYTPGQLWGDGGLKGVLSTVSQPNVTTMAALNSVGTLLDLLMQPGSQGAASHAPAGLLGINKKFDGTSSAGFTAVTDLGLRVTVTPGTGRRLKIIARVSAKSTVANDSFGLQISQDGSSIQQAERTLGPANVVMTLEDIAYIQPSHASHDYDLAAFRNTGTGSITANYGGTDGCSLAVEDAGV